MASTRLAEAGTFTYSGSAQADEPSLVRPGPWLADDVTVVGEVVLPDRSHEVSVDAAGRAVEVITENVVVWGRTGEDRHALQGQVYEVVGETGGQVTVLMGAALLPRWLAVAERHRDEGPDDLGRARYRATVSGAEFTDNTGGSRFASADIVLTVDDSGEPARIEVRSRPGGPSVALSYDIAQIGERWTIDLPGGHPTSVTGNVTAEQVRAAGIDHPVELGALPVGWILYATELRTDSSSPGCASLILHYQDTRTRYPDRHYIDMTVTTPRCATAGPYAEPITLGSYSGTTDVDISYRAAQVTDGDTMIELAADMSDYDLATLFGEIEPFDPFTQPTPVAGLPTS